jgi:hypothetical protein
LQKILYLEFNYRINSLNHINELRICRSEARMHLVLVILLGDVGIVRQPWLSTAGKCRLAGSRRCLKNRKFGGGLWLLCVTMRWQHFLAGELLAVHLRLLGR